MSEFVVEMGRLRLGVVNLVKNLKNLVRFEWVMRGVKGTERKCRSRERKL